MKTIELKKPNILLSIAKGKCPYCHTGEVFKKSAGLWKMPVMNVECPECNYRFEREPGYFLGAMYVSYGIAVFAGILTFLALRFLAPTLSIIYIPITIICVIIAISKRNFKLSRIIYLHIFSW